MKNWRTALHKALAIGLTPTNILTYISLRCPERFGVLSGTLRLYLKARLLGIQIGSGVRCHGSIGLLRWPGGCIRIGDDVSFISTWRRATASTTSAPTRLRVFGKGCITISDGCELTATSITVRSSSVTLGKKVLVGPNTVIVDSDFHAPWPPELRSTNPGLEYDRPVQIDDYAWIGMRCLILKGVHIGTGAIIGAGSVVTHDIPAHTLACGVPARSIRSIEPDLRTT